jgi:glycosyltransferase involved in cell wall biosynthesis
VIRDSALYVHIGRGDSFPVTVIEAMLGGLPAVVSEWNGAKELVERVSGKMVVPLDKSSIYAAIDGYFSLPPRSKKLLSAKARRAASRMDGKAIIKAFVDDYDRLIKRLE